MNLFGFEIHLSNSNNKFVKKEHCHEAMGMFNNRLTEVKDFLNQRITDVCSKMDTITDLLNSKK